jgi:hypothetical protein
MYALFVLCVYHTHAVVRALGVFVQLGCYGLGWYGFDLNKQSIM